MAQPGQATNKRRLMSIIDNPNQKNVAKIQFITELLLIFSTTDFFFFNFLAGGDHQRFLRAGRWDPILQWWASPSWGCSGPPGADSPSALQIFRYQWVQFSPSPKIPVLWARNSLGSLKPGSSPLPGTAVLRIVLKIENKTPGFTGKDEIRGEIEKLK